MNRSLCYLTIFHFPARPILNRLHSDLRPCGSAAEKFLSFTGKFSPILGEVFPGVLFAKRAIFACFMWDYAGLCGTIWDGCGIFCNKYGGRGTY